MDDIYAINLAKTTIREGFNEGSAEKVLSVYDDAFADMSFGVPSFYYSDAREVFQARLHRRSPIMTSAWTFSSLMSC